MRSAGLLGLGRGGQAVIMLAVMALSARTLGVEDFGALILIQSLILAIAKMARFQTWQALVHYGMKAQAAGDMPRIQRVVKFTLLLDFCTAFAAYAVVWIVCGPAIALFDLDPSLSGAALLYGSAIMLTVLNGTPNGVLQLYDRFDRIALQTLVAPLIRFFGSLYLFMTDGNLLQFLIVWYAAEVLSALVLIFMGWLTMYENGIVAGLLKRTQSLLRPEPGIWRYVGGTQLSSTLDLCGTHLPVLFVGALLGPSAAGLFRVAKEFSSVLIKPADKLLARAIYPELARFSAQNDVHARRQMIFRTAALIGSGAFIVFAVFLIFGHQLIALTAGPAFSGAYAPMIWLCLAGVISAAGFALEPVLISSGVVRQTVFARALACAIFIPSLYFLLLQHGVVGAGMANLVYTCLVSLFMLLAGRQLLKKPSSEKFEHD